MHEKVCVIGLDADDIEGRCRAIPLLRSLVTLDTMNSFHLQFVLLPLHCRAISLCSLFNGSRIS